MDLEKKIKLANYLKSQINDVYYENIPERYLLARELMYSYNDEKDKETAIYRNMTPFMNLNNLTLNKIDSEEKNTKYWITFPNRFSSINDLYQNFDFGNRHLFMYKDQNGELKNSTNGMVVGINRRRKECLITTLSIILFYIYFGYHPLCGREYYQNIDSSLKYNKDFFSKKHKFIFDLDNNSNRFVNGYHDKAFELWNQSSEQQKKFWKKVFNNKYLNYDLFFDAWKKAYDNFEIINVETPCGEDLEAIIFKNGYDLIISKNKIGSDILSCYKCNDKVFENCDSCLYNYPKIRITKMKIKVINPAETKTINLYPKEIIYLNDLIVDEKEIPIFEVVPSKKISDLLGLKILLDEKINVSLEDKEKNYSKDEVIPLLSNISIKISDDCKIVVQNENN